MTKIQKFWDRFLNKHSLPNNTVCSDIFSFDITQKKSNYLLQLVLEEKKTATTSLYIEKEFNTRVGEYNIVTTFRGVPKAIIQITDVKILKLKDMTFELARLEGEDETFDSWKKTHEEFLSVDAKNYNMTLNENTLIVFEIFKLVYKE